MDGSGSRVIRSTCAYCGVGCGLLLRPDGAGGLLVEGDPEHPANHGRLCGKGLALGETLSLDGRLLHPLVGGRRADWDGALDLVARRFSQTIAQHGPDSVAFYVSGQFLTEDYYVANKLMKGFIGSANIDTNSRLCMASAVAGHKRAFGTDTVPGTYADFEEADLVVIVGSNLAWCHPVLYQRLVAARRARGTKVVVIDPRRTATCEIADLHLAIRPGADVALFNGLLGHLHEVGAIDPAYVLEHTAGFDAALSAASSDSLDETGLAPGDLAAFFDLVARTERTLTVFSQGVNQSASGTDKVNAIINCHLATGRIGGPGMGPFSVTGQPNAMGGREVGGLANMLAAHLDIEDPAHRAAVRDFWQSPSVPEAPGLKAVDMFRAVEDGRIKALWIACTNPAATLPDADRVARAIAACDFVVVSDLTAATDTARLAHVVLPATGWGEKDGTVTNSDRTVSRQRRVLPAPGEARPDWWMFAEVGARMGWGPAFAYDGPAEIFREHAALSSLASGFGRDFDISALDGIGAQAYDDLAPFRWPTGRSDARFFGDGAFFTPDGRARFVAVRQAARAVSAEYPYRLNTGRIRDQWHTMTRSGKSARLSRHLGEPFLQIHPADAEPLGLDPAGLARVTSATGAAILRVLISADVTPGAPFAPMHWTGETASAGRVGALIAPLSDPQSGQPASKAGSVRIEPYPATWYGFAVSRRPFQPETPYWARSRADRGWRAELAGETLPGDWVAFAKALFGTETESETYIDRKSGTARIAFHADGRLDAALFTGPAPVALSRAHIEAALGERGRGLLSGRARNDAPDPGPTICSCMNVGRNTILAAAARTPGLDAVCEATGAGRTCGSCRPEIARLIAQPVPG